MPVSIQLLSATRLLFAIVALSAIALVSGCASIITEEQCVAGDWYEIGHQRALRGEPLELRKILKACRKHEADVDQRALSEGYLGGIADYCEPDRIRLTLYEGSSHNTSMCRSNSYTMAEQARNEGLQARQLQQRVDASADRIERLRQHALDWSPLERDIADYTRGRQADDCQGYYRRLLHLMRWDPAYRGPWQDACGWPHGVAPAADERMDRRVSEVVDHWYVLASRATREIALFNTEIDRLLQRLPDTRADTTTSSEAVIESAEQQAQRIALEQRIADLHYECRAARNAFDTTADVIDAFDAEPPSPPADCLDSCPDC